jgi:predicted DNA-binding protein (UPF0251 family)
MKPRILSFKPSTITFTPTTPDGVPVVRGDPIYMSYDEFEAFHLIYGLNLNQEEAAKRMGISRGTVWRCLESARKKVAMMLAERRPLVVTPTLPQPEPPKETGT